MQMKTIVRKVMNVFCLLLIASSVMTVASAGHNKYVPFFEEDNGLVNEERAWAVSYAVNTPNMNVLEVSDSANFEVANEFVCYQYVKGDTLKIINCNEEVSYTTFKDLQKYECHFFGDDHPLEMITDGSLNDNLKHAKMILTHGLDASELTFVN